MPLGATALMAGGIGKLAGGIGSLFGNKKSQNPANVANQYLSQIPGAVQPYFQPYIQSGQQALSQLQPQYNQMFTDPAAYYNNLGQGYQESPGYQFKLNQAMQAGGNAAAAGGMLGSPQHQQQAMQLANDIGAQDYNDYINHIMGVLGMGNQGLQNLNTQGYNASTDYASALGNTLGQQAAYGYSGAAGQNAGKQTGIQNIFGGLGNAVAGYLGRK